MSVATPFKSDGMGNGFPFCPTTIDVVAFDRQRTQTTTPTRRITHWITLGGYSKDDFDASTPVTDAQIELSKQNAMKLFWNLEKVTGEASHASSGASVTEMPVTSSPDGGDLAPKDRVCLGFGIGGSVVHNPGPAVAVMNASIGIIRMVAGDTFLGYGIPALPRTTSGLLYTNGIHAGTSYDYPTTPHVALWSMATQDPINVGVFAYTIKNGIHFVGYAESDGGVADATVPSATAYLNVAVARIDELEFFTYP